ncbi:beta-ketoacyl-ACP synthase III [Rhodococcus coprophilus]|uniref:Beta-ketoacyl-[acyl-carrier-protein] synthase III n=1 Tax=Rhodococcus coprophilus TaxID=38310 RepID=A0A2X4XGU3_9NOCA|nr:beta-ketoacyl-ACP synthase III [Rhodococcus coprophilus]MBM7459372.1 beta-ketoacyl ACP synthase [Rhodococcus coprophilus]SQI35874.1 beta-ketoacyl-acp synthase i fabh [Rhodococcus coprophilus]
MGAQIAVPATLRNSALLGLGVHRPERVVTNAEICEQIDSSDEWIQSRSGIKERRFAKPHPEETIVDMSVSASEKALDAAGLTGAQIDTVIIATSTYGFQTPQAAALVADRLGTGGASALDLQAGCAGFCYALGVASDLVRAGTAEKVLVVGVERMSDATEPTDRSVRFIFGDGAGAVVVGASDEVGVGSTVWGSDGSQGNAIRQEPDWVDFAQNPQQKRPWIIMEGTAVFRWAAFEMSKYARQIAEKSGVALADLDAFVPHQANLRINDVIVKQLELPESVQVADDIIETGNTSAASIPLAMEKMLRTGQVQPGDTALLLAFGAGLSYAGQIVKMPPLAQ